MIRMLIKVLKIISSDVRRAVIGVVVALLIGGTAGALYLSRKVLSVAVQTARTPIPLWATMSLVLLCGLVVHLKWKRRFQARFSSKVPPKVFLVEVGGFKWKTKIFQNGEFKLHPIPYCTIHEIELVLYPHREIYACPVIHEPEIQDSTIRVTELPFQQDVAHSLIEHRIKEGFR